jgi:hypothetical protein
MAENPPFAGLFQYGSIMDTGLQKALSDVKGYLAHAKLSVADQKQRIDRLRALGLPTEDAQGTLAELLGLGACAIPY